VVLLWLVGCFFLVLLVGLLSSCFRSFLLLFLLCWFLWFRVVLSLLSSFLGVVCFVFLGVLL